MAAAGGGAGAGGAAAAAAAALAAAPGGGPMNVADIVAILQAIPAAPAAAAAAEPERDIKLKCFESGDPQEWLQWRARFVNIARGKGWNDAQQRRALSQSMGGKAIEATQHIRIEEDVAAGLPAVAAGEALDAYEAKFITAAGTTQARSDFLAAAQMNGETLTQWHTRVGTLYRRAHPNADVETSHELIERFCLGLWNSTIAERTLTDHPATMTLALNNASRHLATKVTMARRLDGGGRQQRSLNAIKEPRNKDDSNANSGNGKKDDGNKKVAAIRCFFCKKLGHQKKDCYSFQRAQANRQAGRNNSNSGKPANKGGRFPRNVGGGGGQERPSLNALASYLEAALGNDGESKEQKEGEEATVQGN